MKSNSKENNILLIITYFILLITLIFGSYYLGKKFTKLEEEPKENKEQVITNLDLTKELMIKQDVIGLYKANYIYQAGYIYDDIKSQDMSDSAKLNTVLLYLYLNNEYKILSYYEYEDLQLPEYSEEGIRYFEYDTVSKLYKDVYGSELTTTTPENTYPLFNYNEKYSIFIVEYHEEETCGSRYSIANNLFTEDEDHAYIYSYVGYVTCPYSLYRDLDMQKFITEYSYEEGAHFIYNIDNMAYENKDQLDYYKIAFIKKNNNYYFDYIEKQEE